MSAVTRLPLEQRKCSLCTFHRKNYLGHQHYCLFLGRAIGVNFAKMGCLAFSVESVLRVVGNIDSPPFGRNVTKKIRSYDANDNLETVEFYQDDILLFTLTHSYDASQNLETTIRSEAKKEESDT